MFLYKIGIRNIIILILILSAAQVSIAQGIKLKKPLDKVVVGKIVDNGVPVAGASVIIDGTSIGTVTNADGNFILKYNDAVKNTSNEIKLSVSALGFSSDDFKFKDSSLQTLSSINAINLNLQEKAASLTLKKFSLTNLESLNFTNEEIKDFIKKIPISSFTSQLSQSITKIELLDNVKKPITPPVIFNQYPLKVNLNNLNVDDFKNFYLFDVFSGDSCSHGDKVYDVVRQLLHLYHLDFAIQKVIKRPINYFSHVQAGDSLYYQYLMKTKQDLPTRLKYSIIDSVTTVEKLNSNSETPSRYLLAIYFLAADEEPDIISSSFVGQSDDTYFIKTFKSFNTNTNFLTAALNEPEYIEEKNFFSTQSNEPFSVDEPLTTYYKFKNDIGTIIVGNQIDSGKFEGMYSKDGENVTVLGKGKGWGLYGYTTCIDSIDIGTSFSTPEVATKLFVAKAFWRKNNLFVSALEARNRMVLSSNIEPPFVGKFASAGSININKLLRSGVGFLVTKNDSIIDIDSVYSYPSISFKTPFGYSQKIISSKEISSLRGIYISDDSTYTIANSNNNTVDSWKKEPTPDLLNIVCKLSNGQIKILDKKEFYSNYKEFVILK